MEKGEGPSGADAEWKAPTQGPELTEDQRKEADTIDKETQFREQRRISAEIDKIQHLLNQYQMAKEVTSKPEPTEKFNAEAESLEDLNKRIDQVKSDYDHTSKLSFRKRSELKMQWHALLDMARDQGGGATGKRMTYDSAKEIVGKFEEQYGSEDAAKEKMSQLREELSNL